MHKLFNQYSNNSHLVQGLKLETKNVHSNNKLLNTINNIPITTNHLIIENSTIYTNTCRDLIRKGEFVTIKNTQFIKTQIIIELNEDTIKKLHSKNILVNNDLFDRSFLTSMVTRRINSNLDFLSQIVNEIEELSHWYYAENECEDELLITCRSH